MADKRKQKKAKRRAAALPKAEPLCSHCGKPGRHFMPPSFGDPGLYMCDSILNPTLRPAGDPHGT